MGLARMEFCAMKAESLLSQRVKGLHELKMHRTGINLRESILMLRHADFFLLSNLFPYTHSENV